MDEIPMDETTAPSTSTPGSTASVRRGSSVTTGGGRPSGGAYKLASGKRVPSVTTILGRWKESGGLVQWAYNCGRDGIDMNAARDGAATIGSVVHGAAEDYIHDAHPRAVLEERISRDLGDDAQKGLSGFDAFVEWWETLRPQITHTEIPMVSERYAFGGTLDYAGIVNGRPSLIDLKSSNAIYHEYLIQLGAYTLLWKEHTGEDFTAWHLARVSKNTGGFTHHYWRDLGKAPDLFLRLREAYDLDREVKAMLK